MKTICVLGMGYIGLPMASMFANRGMRVIGVDVNSQVVQRLQRGEIDMEESGLRTAVQDAMQSGSLRIECKPEPADVFIIAVPTPINPDKSPDMRPVRSAAESIVPHLRSGNLVVLESTSPPGTTVGLVRSILERSGLKAGHVEPSSVRHFLLAYSPERVLPGQILKELVENARVIGGVDRASAEAAQELYSAFVEGEIVLTDATTAEMVKLMENTFRDVNIALANEFALISQKVGINVWEAINIANRHPRVNILRPGPGVGGHCIAVDPWFLVESAPDMARLIRQARLVNDAMPERVVEVVTQAIAKIPRPVIACLGLSYKPDVDDIRESPAVEVARLLSKNGVEVKAYEPYREQVEIAGVSTVATLAAALEDADAILLLVKHRVFKALRPVGVAAMTRSRLVIDTVDAWIASEWQANGFRIVRLGG